MADIDLLTDVAREAGALALTYFQNNPKTWVKGEASIVSEADYAVDALLAKQLLAARPDYGWLSEETVDDPAGRDRRRVFVVDPIDGTRGFLAGGNEWTISLAVVEAGRPIAAALFAPALGTMFAAAAGNGAFRDGMKMSVSTRTELAGANVAGSRRLVRDALEFASIQLEYRGFVPSLAYRFALVASGEIDVAIARPGAYDWDLAACDLLVHEAGGRLADLAGRLPRYNGPNRRHPTLLASTPALSDPMASLVEQAERERPG
jgi:myo-inositol-1(or 4)-monophosphatase